MSQPRALVIVAWIFIVGGIMAIVSMIGNVLVGHRVSIDLTVIELWIGLGLLRHQARWRRWALFFLSAGFVILPILLVLVTLLPKSPGVVTIFNRPIWSAPFGVVALFIVSTFGLSVWQYR